MRKWWVVGALGVLIAMPAFAGQKSDAANDAATTATSTDNSSSTNNTESSAAVAPATNIFAVPMPPRATPFPPAPPTLFGAGAEANGQITPKFEIAFLYQYVNFSPGDVFRNFNSHGGSGEVVYNPSRWLGIVGQAGGYTFTRDLSPIAASNPTLTNPSATDGG